jgi:hypothetical protein
VRTNEIGTYDLSFAVLQLVRIYLIAVSIRCKQQTKMAHL